jgi:hypothetical protein
MLRLREHADGGAVPAAERGSSGAVVATWKRAEARARNRVLMRASAVGSP